MLCLDIEATQGVVGTVGNWKLIAGVALLVVAMVECGPGFPGPQVLREVRYVAVYAKSSHLLMFGK